MISATGGIPLKAGPLERGSFISILMASYFCAVSAISSVSSTLVRVSLSVPTVTNLRVSEITRDLLFGVADDFKSPTVEAAPRTPISLVQILASEFTHFSA